MAFWINIYECQLYPKHGHLSVNYLKNDSYCQALYFIFFLVYRLRSLKNVRAAVKELESFSAIWMEALLIQSFNSLIVKSVKKRNIQALVLKESTLGGQSLPKSSIMMLLPEKSALHSLKAHVKLKSILFYNLNLWSKFWIDPAFENGFGILVTRGNNTMGTAVCLVQYALA